MIEIPFKMLAPDTLQGLIEDFVTRDGTDYGEREKSVHEKSTDVMNQLRSGEIVIVFDEYTQSCGLTQRTGLLKSQASESIYDLNQLEIN